MTTGDWTTGHVFISHSSRDDAIRNALLACGVPVWDDARQLTAGAQLEPEIRRALGQAQAVITVLSPLTISSKWVTKEIRYAPKIQRQRGLAYKVIPVIVNGIEPSGLHLWFPEGPLGLTMKVTPGGVQDIHARITLSPAAVIGCTPRVEHLGGGHGALQARDTGVDLRTYDVAMHEPNEAFSFRGPRGVFRWCAGPVAKGSTE